MQACNFPTTERSIITSNQCEHINRVQAEQQEWQEIGPSGVRALPLAAGRNKGGHYFRYFGPSVLRAPAEQTKVATVLGN